MSPSTTWARLPCKRLQTPSAEVWQLVCPTGLAYALCFVRGFAKPQQEIYKWIRPVQIAAMLSLMLVCQAMRFWAWLPQDRQLTHSAEVWQSGRSRFRLACRVITIS